MKILNTIAPLLSLLLLCACASSSGQRVPMPRQDVAIENPSLSRIYFTRADQVYGSLRTVRLEDSAAQIGSIGKNDYLCWERPAGRTLLRAVFEGRDIDYGEKDGFLDLKAERGRVYYCVVGVGSADGAPVIELVETGAGQELIGKRSPATVNNP